MKTEGEEKYIYTGYINIKIGPYQKQYSETRREVKVRRKP